MIDVLRPPLGWPLSPLPDEFGRLDYPGLEDSVRQTIKIILSTRPGEQSMRPDFGAGLDLLLHEPNTLSTRRQIRDRVQESLTRWEPRIILDAVEVWEVANQPTYLRVEIAYRLVRNGSPGQVALTVQLEG
ncbi:MAG: GPW/gp25 family protein [Candidatus Methylumidiphilus sp.]